MSRHFRHLTKAEIAEIVLAHTDGESQASLARRYDVDHSTIHYHIQKYETAYPEQGGVYARLKMSVRRTCVHPSSRCTICTEMMDELKRKERSDNDELRKRLDAANSRLRVAGLPVE